MKGDESLPLLVIETIIVGALLAVLYTIIDPDTFGLDHDEASIDYDLLVIPRPWLVSFLLTSFHFSNELLLRDGSCLRLLDHTWNVLLNLSRGSSANRRLCGMVCQALGLVRQWLYSHEEAININRNILTSI